MLILLNLLTTDITTRHSVCRNFLRCFGFRVRGIKRLASARDLLDGPDPTIFGSKFHRIETPAETIPAAWATINATPSEAP